MTEKTLGYYRVLGKLGEGGMVEVYRARDPKLNRDVALKVLPDDLAQDPERLACFKHEAQVLELVEGPTLPDRISQRAIPLHEAILFTLTACDQPVDVTTIAS